MTSPAPVTNIIDGKSVAGSSENIRQVLNPSTGEVIAELTESTTGDGDAAVEAARAAFPEWAAKPPGARSTLLHQLVNLLEENIDELAQLESIDAGKPITVARGDELPGMVAAFVTSPAQAGSFQPRPQATSPRATPATSGVNRSGSSSASHRGTSLSGRRFGSWDRLWPRATPSSSSLQN